MLEVRNLRKRYSGIPAVDGVSFVARAGEVTGYLGANGSGKSTTMKLATGLIEPTSGEILFEGQSIKADPMAYRPGKAGIHFAFWVGVLFLLRLLHEAAQLEGRLLHGLLSGATMIVMVALAAIGMRYLSASRAALTDDLLFEEAYPTEVTSLGLN
jgi:ABC-type Mn2+/Zn2+ transport system ATPase subunit